MGRRWQILIGGTALALLLVLLVWPWLAQCRGKSLELRVVIPRVQVLIERYRRETGEWPPSWKAIVERYHPPLDYDYELICYGHPWRHHESGTLQGLELRGPGPHNWDEFPIFEIKRPGWLAWTRVVVSDTKPRPAHSEYFDPPGPEWTPKDAVFVR